MATSWWASIAVVMPARPDQIAGSAFLTWPRPDYLQQQGGTGYGVRLIAELARSLT